MALSYTQLEFISREMASLARARIPLPEGLRSLAAAGQSTRLREAYLKIAAALDQGQPLSAALAGAAAPAEFVAAIRCAEVSGDMADVLEYAIDHCRRVDRFYGRLANIALYPILILSLAAPILTVLCMVVIPKFHDIFFQIGANLPWLTRMVLEASALLRGGLGLAILVLSLLVFIWTCSPLFIRTMPFLLRHLPFFRELLVLSDLAMLMRFFERMLRRGLPLPTVLRAASLAVWSMKLRIQLVAMAVKAEQGGLVFAALQGLIPALPLHLLEQAEKRGDLVETCPGIASYCEDRFNLRAEAHVRRLEPILIVLLGLIVGSIVVSLYLPLFSIPKLIGNR